MQDFTTINGVVANGGSFGSSGGAVIANGMLFITAGYTGIMQGAQGNVVLAFAAIAGLNVAGVDFYSLQKGEPAESEALSLRDPGNAGWRRDLSVSHERIGEVLSAQGDLSGALGRPFGNSPGLSVLALFPGGFLVVPAIWTWVTTAQRVRAVRLMALKGAPGEVTVTSSATPAMPTGMSRKMPCLSTAKGPNSQSMTSLIRTDPSAWTWATTW